MATIPTLDYLVDYYDLEPSLFRESDNLHKLFQSIFYVCHIQQIELLWFAENILNIDAAENAHLDFIGSIVGQPRFLTDFNTEPYFGYEGSYQSKTFGSSLDPEVGGYWNSRSYFNTASSRQLNDDEYRRLIKARAIYNQSNCTANDLLEVINLLSNSKNNTVQMLNHGLIQINTDDSSGIISYFVDRLLNDDNILPIAAGVRVGLEALPTGEGGGDDTPPVGNDSGLVFSTHNYAVDENKDYPISIYASGVSGDWSLTSNGVLLADYTGYASSEVSLGISPDGQEVFIELLGISTGSRRYGLLIDADEVYFETIDYDEPTGLAKGEFVLYDWSNSIKGYHFRMPDTVIEVPNYLPEQITSTAFMFEYSNLFNSDISNWDMSRITEATAMFRYAKTFNSDISNWQVGQVEDFFGMFDGSLDFNQDLSNWDVRSASYFSGEFITSSGLEMMFKDATSFNQDLSSWCVSNQLAFPRDFDSGAVNWSLPKPIWGTCPSEDWEVKKVYEGSTGSRVGIDAVRTKNNLEEESSIEVTPTVGQISDRIKSGEYGAGVNKAVLDIDPEATEWVLDPANNQIKYSVTGGDGGSWEQTCGFSFGNAVFGTGIYPTTDALCQSLVGYRNVMGKTVASATVKSGQCVGSFSGGGSISVGMVGDVCDEPPPETEPVEKYIPIDTISAKVIANAESGHAESKILLIAVVSVLASMKVYDSLF